MLNTKRSGEASDAKSTKRPRSSLHRTKNTAWDFAPQHRRSVVNQGVPLGLGQAFGSLIVPCEDEDEDVDVDEAAAALLAMSCPEVLPQELPKRKSPSTSPRQQYLVPKAAASISYAPDPNFQFPPVAAPMEVQQPMNLQVPGAAPLYPRLIISSKSNASDESSATNLDLKTAAGGSTESIQSTGLLQPALERRHSKVGEADPSGNTAGQPRREEHPRSQSQKYVNPYLIKGATISTGLPQAMQELRDKAVSEPKSKPSNSTTGRASPHATSNSHATDSRSVKPASKDAAQVQYTLKPNPATPACHLGSQQPAVRSRGGRLIVLPDKPPSPQGHRSHAPPQRLSSAHSHPSWQAPLVLAKASQPRLQTTPWAPKGAGTGGSAHPTVVEPKRIVLSQPRLVSVRSEPRMANTYTLDQGREGGQEGSGEESSEEAWQPNWGLSLFSALNPNVITTGLSIADQGRSTSQPLDAK